MNFCATLVWLLVLAGSPARQQPPAAKQQNPAASAEAAAPAIDPAKEADIRKLMELSGAGILAKQTMGRMTEAIKPLISNALPPGEYREKLIELFFAKFQSNADPKQLLDMAVPSTTNIFPQMK